MINKTTKKFLRGSLAAGIFLVLISLPLITDAQGYKPLPDAAAQNKLAASEINCIDYTLAVFPKINVSNCVLLILGTGVYYVLWVFSWILWVVSKFFNTVLAIQFVAFHNQAIVNTGWTIARNVVNIFYVFILLIIAIATILRLESYGMKRLLVSLIVSALLVNFSLPLAGLIIDLGNVIGNTFYVNMGSEQDADCKGLDAPCRDISEVLIAGFRPQKIYQPNNERSATAGVQMLFDLLLAGLMGIVLILVASLVLGAAIVMLLVRIVYLWVLMIVSPFAFFFWILPDTRSYSNQWLQALLKQTFMYPAFMFMIYLVLTAIDKGVIKELFKLDSRDMFSTRAGEATASTATAFSVIIRQANFILSFIFLAMLLFASLLVAQSMGAVGAGAAIKYGKTAGKWAQGYAGRVANRRLAEPLSRKVTEGAVGRMIGKIPLARQALRAPAASVRKAEEDAKKEAAYLKNLSPAGQAAAIGSLSARAKAQHFEGLNDKQKNQFLKELGKQGPDATSNFARTIHSLDRSKNYDKEVAKASGDVTAAMRVLGHDGKPPADYQREVDNFLLDLTDDQKKNFFTAQGIRENENIRNNIINTFTLRDVGRTATDTERAQAIGNLLNDRYVDGTIERRNPRLNQDIDRAPGLVIFKLGRGERLAEGNYPTRRRGREGTQTSGGGGRGPTIITPPGGGGGPKNPGTSGLT